MVAIQTSQRKRNVCPIRLILVVIAVIVTIIQALVQFGWLDFHSSASFASGNKPNKPTTLQREKSVNKDLSISVPEKSPLPSAKTLLTSKPPFEDSDMIMFESKLVQSPNTVVTGYFRIPSKHGSGDYDKWMSNMLSLQDAMVIFTHAELVDQIKEFRKHALQRTVVIPIALDDLPIGTLYPVSFWEDQLERDPEKKIHRSYQVFWIWLSKSWCVNQAIRLNPFQSDLFVWSDIGCFRNKKFNHKTMVLQRENVPPHEIIQMAHHDIKPPEEELYNDKYKRPSHFYHSGSQMAGYEDAWIKFHSLFLEIIDRFLEKNMIIVEDQAVLQSTCLSYPKMCAYVPYDQVGDNKYFGLRTILHKKGDYKYWRHPKASTGIR